MRGVNKVIILGRVGRTPESRTSQEGRTVTTFSMATDHVWVDKAGERHESTEWHRIVSFGRTAELVARFIQKGHPLYLEGQMRTRQWSDQNGQARTMTEVVADKLEFLNSGPRPTANASSPGATMAAVPIPSPVDSVSDLPF